MRETVVQRSTKPAAIRPIGMSYDLVMIGFEPEGGENLSLRLLAGAATRAGFSAAVETASDLGDIEGCVERALRIGPSVLGLSLQDGPGALHALALARLARNRGYTGCIVCGGSLATLQPGWVLDRALAVDCVIRFAGEEPLVRLLSTLASGGDLADVPSLVTRDLETPPLPEASIPNWLPLRGERPRIMGVPTAEVISGRGCRHRCDYCTHAAQSAMVVRECRDAGVSVETLRAAGLGTPVVRPVDDLADEMGALYHGPGVRCFGLVDENPVPADEAAAISWVRSLRESLDSRGVGDIGLCMMTRADCLTPAVVEALVNLGLLRTFAGVESGFDAQLASLGRAGDTRRSSRGVALLAEAQVITLFNSLLLHPDSTVAGIRGELEFLSGVQGALFDTVCVRPFVGTRLYERMREEGRVGSGELLPSFVGTDPAVERFGALLARFQTRVLGQYSPTFHAADLLYSASVARRFGRFRRGMGGLFQRLGALGGAVNAQRVETLLLLLERAEADRCVDDVLARSKVRFDVLRGDLERAGRELVDNGSSGLELSRQFFNLSAAAALVFVVIAAPGCYLNEGNDDDSDVGDVDADFETDTEKDTETDTKNNTEKDTETDTTVLNREREEYWSQYEHLHSLIQGNCGFETLFWNSVVVTLDAQGKVDSVEYRGSGWDTGFGQEIIDCYMELLAGEIFPRLAGEEIWFSPALMGID